MRALTSFAALLVSGCFESAAQPGVCNFGERRDCICEDEGPGWETCYGMSPAVWGPCTCNMQPVANAGSNRTVSYKTTVMLDGSLSMDADGPERIYQWAVDSVPAGSAAVLDNPGTVQPTFFADVPGEYRFSLSVGDGLKTSATASVTVIAVNDAPVAIAGSGGRLHTGTSFQLDGSASSDPNGDPLTYQWTVTSAPQGSVAVPASPSSATTTFVPDVHGNYQLTLRVEDGRTSSIPAHVTLEVFFPLTMLPYVVRDAEYSRALDRVLIIGPNSNLLYIYNPATGSSQSLALSHQPNAVALSPDGLTAVVGHDGFVSVVQLQNPAVTLVKPITGTAAFDIVHAGNGYAYVFPSLASRAIQNVPLNGAAVTAGSDSLAFRARLLPGALTMYAAASILDAIYRLDIVNGSATATRAVSAQDCDDLWLTDDAQRIVTRCGTIYSVSSVEAQDMVLEGSLSGASFPTHISQASGAGKLLALPGNAPANATVRIYGYPSLAFERAADLPRFLINDTPYVGYGAYVFLRADNATYTVIEQADTPTGKVFGMATFAL